MRREWRGGESGFPATQQALDPDFSKDSGPSDFKIRNLEFFLASSLLLLLSPSFSLFSLFSPKGFDFKDLNSMAKGNGKKPKLKKTVLQLKQSSTPSDPSFLPSTKVDALSKTSSLFQPSPSTTTPSSISTPLLTLHFTSSSIQHATLSRIEAFYEGKPPLRERYLDLEQARREKLCRNYQAFNFPLGVVDRWLQGMKECWLGKRDGNFNFRGEDTKIDDGRISTKEADGNQSNTKDLKSGEDPTKDTATQSSRNEENRDEPKSEVSIDGTIQSG